jgi:hypothetical protein
MAGQLTIDTLKASSGVLATQNGMTGIAKAWVYFGYISSAITINGSFNVSSVTRNGTGDYTLNFTTAMPNANYVPLLGLAEVAAAAVYCPRVLASTGEGSPVLQSTTQVRIIVAGGGPYYDSQAVYAAILGA